MSGGKDEQYGNINDSETNQLSKVLPRAYLLACVGSSKADFFFGMILKALHGKLPTTMLALMIIIFRHCSTPFFFRPCSTPFFEG